ncbi:MAG: hypothetical protein PQJ58_18570 [Spirochaetales bacterium]|nr:hypothetical protein [Spirochaetales bacterium]
MSQKLKNAENLYLEGIRDGHYVEAVNKYTGARYTQHSTGVRDGKEGFIEFFGPFVERNPYRDIQLIRKLEDGRNVFIQAYQNINKGEARWVTTDFFDTDDDEKIIEHWDVIAPFNEKNTSGHSSVDGSTKVTDLEKTDENKKLVTNYIRNILMAGGDPSKLDQYVSREQFVEHSAKGEDGYDVLARNVQSPAPSQVYEDIALTVGQGNFVATLCRVMLKNGTNGQELCKADIFRIEKGLIVEHWENSEPVPEESVNVGKF